MKHIFLALGLVLMTATLAHAQSAGLGLTWQDNSSNETGFKIERKLGTTGTFAQISTPAMNVVTYADTNLAYSVNYCYRIRAYNTAGDSGYSNEACGTTITTPIPSTPGTLQVTPLP